MTTTNMVVCTDIAAVVADGVELQVQPAQVRQVGRLGQGASALVGDGGAAQCAAATGGGWPPLIQGSWSASLGNNIARPILEI